MNRFQQEIEVLIEKKSEGEYWDFKQQDHANKSDLLHDILCLANNPARRDAYLIFGVVLKMRALQDNQESLFVGGTKNGGFTGERA